MPNFSYVCTDDRGKVFRGTLQAADRGDLQQKLRADGKFLRTCKEKNTALGKSLRAGTLAEFSRQIASLVGAGVSLVRALSIIADEEGLKPRLRRIYSELNRSVRKGIPLSQAMEEQQGVFPPLMIYMYRSAETSGNLETTARRMADYYDKDSRLAAKVKSSMVYPKILGGLIVVVVAVIMIYVMPQFSELFAQMASLPLSTRILFAISDFVAGYWWLLVPLVVIAVVLVRLAARMPAVRLGLDELVLQLPGVGRLLGVIYTARFARNLSSLYACGISLVSALQIARSVVGNAYIESQFDELISFVRSGNPLSQGLARVKGFSKKLSAAVRVGEESGNLEELLVNMADTFDFESETSLNKLVSYAEPAMIVIMAVIVAFIMFAVLMPIYNSYSTFG